MNDMMDDKQIQNIVDRVMREIGQPTAQPIAPQKKQEPRGRSGYGAPPEPGPIYESQDGVFATLDEAVAAANRAYRELTSMPLSIRKDMVAHMRQAGRENATLLAELAHTETGMGRVEDKILKNILNSDKAEGPEALETGAWSGDDGLTVTEWAPYGVIGSLTPSTNPTSTVICTGENQYTRFEFLELLQRRACDIIMPDLAKAGGIMEGKRIAEIADAFYVPIAPHNVSSPLGMMAALRDTFIRPIKIIVGDGNYMSGRMRRV